MALFFVMEPGGVTLRNIAGWKPRNQLDNQPQNKRLLRPSQQHQGLYLPSANPELITQCAMKRMVQWLSSEWGQGFKGGGWGRVK